MQVKRRVGLGRINYIAWGKTTLLNRTVEALMRTLERVKRVHGNPDPLPVSKRMLYSTLFPAMLNIMD